MSTSTASAASDRPLDPKIGLMYCAATHLIPLFKLGSIDIGLARKMAVSAIAAYEPESRADYVNVARTIAFSMAALAVLGRTASGDMSHAEQMHAYGKANTLNRSADQSERTMMRRWKYHETNQSTPNPQERTEVPIDPTPEPVQPVDAAMEAEIGAAIAEAMRQYHGDATQAAAQPPPEPVAPTPNRPSPNQASPNQAPANRAASNRAAPDWAAPHPVSAHATPSADSAIRYASPGQDTARGQTTSDRASTLRDRLLRDSAMPHATAPTVRHPPG
jgi:hypothetical protein